MKKIVQEMFIFFGGNSVSWNSQNIYRQCTSFLARGWFGVYFLVEFIDNFENDRR